MVIRMCRNCKYYNKEQSVDIYEDCSFYIWGIKRTCLNKQSHMYKKNVWDNEMCPLFTTKSSLFKWHNRISYLLYRVDAKLKGVKVKENKK